MASFVLPLRILFQHCDPAGIVFYPRYFELLNQTVEAWFEQGLATPWSVMLMEEERGVPLVRAEVDFRVASRLGDRLDFALDVVRIGRSSVDLALTAREGDGDGNGGGERLTAALTLVHIDRRAGRSLAWPDDLREKMQGFLR